MSGNSNRKTTIFIQENEFENDVCKMSAILSRPQYVKFEKVYAAADTLGSAPRNDE